MLLSQEHLSDRMLLSQEHRFNRTLLATSSEPPVQPQPIKTPHSIRPQTSHVHQWRAGMRRRRALGTGASALEGPLIGTAVPRPRHLRHLRLMFRLSCWTLARSTLWQRCRARQAVTEVSRPSARALAGGQRGGRANLREHPCRRSPSPRPSTRRLVRATPLRLVAVTRAPRPTTLAMTLASVLGGAGALCVSVARPWRGRPGRVLSSPVRAGTG